MTLTIGEQLPEVPAEKGKNDETDLATMETLAKVLPPPNRSTFYVPITTSVSNNSDSMSPPKYCRVKSPSSGPSSPLGDVAGTVISGTMAGLHAVAGLPSAVSSLPIFDNEESVSGISENSELHEQRISNNSNESGDTREPQWSCAECTFLNHPALKECEQCEMPRVMIGTESQRTHQAKNCFCHPQENQVFNQPSSTSSTLPTHVSNNTLLYNTSSRTINQTITTAKNDVIKLTSNIDRDENVFRQIPSESSKVSAILSDSLDRNESPPSESTPCI